MKEEPVPCPDCGTALFFGTDGNGRLLTECPHCTWGWPVDKSPFEPIVPPENPPECPECEGQVLRRTNFPAKYCCEACKQKFKNRERHARRYIPVANRQQEVQR